MAYFEEVKKNFGFGAMRLPLKGPSVDRAKVCEMADEFLAGGFNYFDTAHGYLLGKSETALRDCVVKRHPRDAFVLANKLTEIYFHSEKDIRPFFEKQLKWCGVEYFDFYLMHAQNARNYPKYRRCNAYETALKLKAEGKIGHVGFSFHDKPEVLDAILTENPETEFVQLQFNYADFDSYKVQSRKCYEVCRKHGKPVIVMEPVKGGRLVRLPDEADGILRALGGGSNASYAIRFAAGFEGVFMVLSGMSSVEQMRDNLSYMREFKPLSQKEQAALLKVRAILSEADFIPCTACRYCVEGCPKQIAIPDYFACMNERTLYKADGSDAYRALAEKGGRASDCLACGKCESACPQHLEIRRLLREVAAQFER